MNWCCLAGPHAAELYRQCVSLLLACWKHACDSAGPTAQLASLHAAPQTLPRSLAVFITRLRTLSEASWHHPLLLLPRPEALLSAWAPLQPPPAAATLQLIRTLFQSAQDAALLPLATATAAAAAAAGSRGATCRTMPLTVAEGALLGAGMLFAGGATMAYKAKQTRLFKTLYFLSWPTVGAALPLVPCCRRGALLPCCPALCRPFPRLLLPCAQSTAVLCCICYYLSNQPQCTARWRPLPQLGSAVLWTLMPTDKQMEQVCLVLHMMMEIRGPG